MRFRNGLSLFERTSSRRCFNLAAFHSPHSLTWRWIVSLSVQQPSWVVLAPVFRLTRNSILGLAVGLRGLAMVSAYRDNNGWQLSLALLWLSLSFSQQQPMWYRDMYQRARDERDDLVQEARGLRRLANAAWLGR